MSNSDPIRDAEDAGFDMNLIDLNLSLSPEQRLEAHQGALDLVLELERIRNARIDFVVVGGFAGVLHGSSLVTRDLEVCTLLTPENTERYSGEENLAAARKFSLEAFHVALVL
ncbi:MAG: hypothetical protein JST16_06205 [Bdellovibrionales bacterium]|nr:hypothetical protein [Bdellovibrionales bacterium]